MYPRLLVPFPQVLTPLHHFIHPFCCSEAFLWGKLIHKTILLLTLNIKLSGSVSLLFYDIQFNPPFKNDYAIKYIFIDLKLRQTE